MVDPIIYRTDDATRWGDGIDPDRDLFPEEIDRNFYSCDTRITALEDHAAVAGRSIDYISEDNGSLFVHYTDHSIDGPFPLPVSQWRDRGVWTPFINYAVNDVFNVGNKIYRVLIAHTSAGTFDEGANGGSGFDFYSLMLTIPGIPVFTIADATFTPDLTHANSYIRFTAAAGCLVSIPNSVIVDFPLYTEMHFRDATQSGTGVLFEALSGVTINSVEGFINLTAVRGATVGLKKIDTDEWDIFGLLATHPSA